MAELPTFDRRMSDAEGLMWRLEKDPYLSSAFANVTILDRAPDFDRLLRRMERATMLVDRLRQRVQPVPVNLTAPFWVDDPNFDIHYHVRRVALPAPGSMRQLVELASLIACDPFERTRPLWQFVVVEGLRGGRAALIQKMHHTIADGETSVKMSLEFLDFERDAPEPAPIDRATIERPDDATTAMANQDLLRDLVAGGLRFPLGLLRQIKELLADPTGIPEAGNAAADTIRGLLNQLGDTESAASPLWTKRSLQRRIEVLRAPFGDTRVAAKHLGGTLNTAFITAAAEAAGRYHRELGSPVDHLRASMAVSTRTDSSGSNAFSLARMMVPTGDMPIADRFRAIQAAADGRSLLDAAGAARTTHLPPRIDGDADLDARLESLSPQERRILDHLALGASNREIAEELHLAEKTVKNYVSALLSKMGMTRRTEAAVYAVRLSERRRAR